ncbi:MAG: hypothetical protein QOI90_2917 [Mycobacterium sp.]|nr:hypothetical protein [Mycobacterium sp.]
MAVSLLVWSYSFGDRVAEIVNQGVRRSYPPVDSAIRHGRYFGGVAGCPFPHQRAEPVPGSNCAGSRV